MNIKEAKDAYDQGKKIRIVTWPEGDYFSKDCKDIYWNLCSIFEAEYEIYQEPIEYVDFNTAMKALSEGHIIERRDEYIDKLYSIRLNDYECVALVDDNFDYYIFEKDDILATNWVIKKRNINDE